MTQFAFDRVVLRAVVIAWCPCSIDTLQLTSLLTESFFALLWLRGAFSGINGGRVASRNFARRSSGSLLNKLYPFASPRYVILAY